MNQERRWLARRERAGAAPSSGSPRGRDTATERDPGLLDGDCRLRTHRFRASPWAWPGPSSLLLGLLLLAVAIAGPRQTQAADGGASKPGAYCPLPARGQKPVCLSPAEEQYEDFFAGLESGAPSEGAALAVERDLLSGGDGDYLALSSIAYGYYRLTQQAASLPDPNPILVARLERWNELLSSVYASEASSPSYRDAVRRAAQDIREKTPEGPGESTSATLIAALERIDDPGARHGVRGALTRLFERLVGQEAR